MQEEINRDTVNIAVKCLKIVAKEVIAAGKEALTFIKDEAKKGVNEIETIVDNPDNAFHGGKRVKDLIGNGDSVTPIDVSETDLAGFEGIARKFGVEYSIIKNNDEKPPSYTVFFKAKNAELMGKCFDEYMRKALEKDKKPSVEKQLKDMTEKAKSVMPKTREKHQEVVR